MVCFGTVVQRLIEHIAGSAEGGLVLCRIQTMVSPSFEASKTFYGYFSNSHRRNACELFLNFSFIDKLDHMTGKVLFFSEKHTFKYFLQIHVHTHKYKQNTRNAVVSWHRITSII